MSLKPCPFCGAESARPDHLMVVHDPDCFLAFDDVVPPEEVDAYRAAWNRRPTDPDAYAAGYAQAVSDAAGIVNPTSMSDAHMRLLGGEMTAQEIRSVRAFMSAATRGIRALRPGKGEG